MNKLYVLNELGFKISWNLIVIGLYGNGEISPLITRLDVVNYLDNMLTDINDQTDNIISLISENDCTKFDRLLEELAKKDTSNFDIQKRKWRVYLLKMLIDNVNEDWMQGLLELMGFWISMGKPDDCPQTFPNSDNKKSIQDYFTPTSYEFNLSKNREWLNEEINYICKQER